MTQGLVEYCSEETIEGWIVSQIAGAVVSLYVNDQVVAETTASDPIDRSADETIRRFRFNIRKLWDFVDTSAFLEIRLNSACLPIANHGMLMHPAKNGRKKFSQLLAKLSAGYVFSDRGTLQLSKCLDVAWQKSVVALFKDVKATLSESISVDLFPAYGTLLGGVRDQAFIGHDRDFDTMFISLKRQKEEITRDVLNVCRCLISAGFFVKATVLDHLKVSYQVPKGSKSPELDLFWAAFDDSGLLCTSFGEAGEQLYKREHFLDRWERLYIAGFEFDVPAFSRIVVRQLYGENWLYPDSGFDWRRDKKAKHRWLFLTQDQQQSVYWEMFYSATEIGPPSPFSVFVQQLGHQTEAVIDLGCGTGKGAVSFARQGYDVIGVDQSEIAMRRANQWAVSNCLNEKLSFCAVDICRQGVVTKVRRRLVGRSATLYARFFLHSIREEQQELLIDELEQCMLVDDRFAAEFRVLEDEAKEKVHGDHKRRYIDFDWICRRFEYSTFCSLEVVQKGNQLAPYRNEDPIIGRIVVRRADGF